jgi:hypothetical protein
LANTLTPRIGRFTRHVWYPESTPGTDPGSPVGVVLNARDVGKYVAKQSPSAKAPVYKANARPDDASYGDIVTVGQNPYWLDFVAAPSLFKSPVGTLGYTRIPLAVGSLHRFFIPAGVYSPITGQMQYELSQATAQFLRLPYSVIKALKLSYPQNGSVPFDVDFVGVGIVKETDLAGTKTDYGFAATSSFNGTLKVAGIVVIGLKNFAWTLDCGAAAEAVAMNAGVASAVTTDAINCTTAMTLMLATDGTGVENNLTIMHYGTSQTPIALDVLYANLPTALATQWCRIMQPNNLADWETPTGGGKGGKSVAVNLMMVDRSAATAAEAWGTTIGPYTLGATPALAFKIDGGGSISTTAGLTAGTMTATAIVGALNANATLAAVATPDVFNGRLRVTSKTTGSTSSVQCDTSVANSQHAALGFVGTSIPGVSSPLLIEFYNGQNTDY